MIFNIKFFFQVKIITQITNDALQVQVRTQGQVLPPKIIQLTLYYILYYYILKYIPKLYFQNLI